MSMLFTSPSDELCLTLRGLEEDRVLATVRRWPHWRRVDIERDPANAERCLAVTLVTDPMFESTMREILKRSFGMTFPDEGGSCEIAPASQTSSRRRDR